MAEAMMEQLILMTKQRAEQLVIEINSGISTIGGKVLELYEGEGWRVLGYNSWRDCVMNELQFQKTQVYQLLNFAKVERNLSAIAENISLPQTESHARPLSTLEPDQQREAWQKVIEQNPDGNITAKKVEQVVKDFNYKRDTKRATPQDIYTPKGYDACQTPPEALDPLLPHIPQYIDTVWEPAAGEGYLVEALQDSSFNVISSDILTGQNFFEWNPQEDYGCIITNPPYSIKYQWLEHCYNLGKPFALLMPGEMLFAKTAMRLFKKYNIEVVCPDGRINFKMPNKGWEGKGAQFPVAWFTWGLNIGERITFEIEAIE